MSKVTLDTFSDFVPITTAIEKTHSNSVDKFAGMALIKVPQVNQLLHLLLRCHPDYLSMTNEMCVIAFFSGPGVFTEDSFYFALEDETIHNFSMTDCLRNIR